MLLKNFLLITLVFLLLTGNAKSQTLIKLLPIKKDDEVLSKIFQAVKNLDQQSFFSAKVNNQNIYISFSEKELIVAKEAAGNKEISYSRINLDYTSNKQRQDDYNELLIITADREPRSLYEYIVVGKNNFYAGIVTEYHHMSSGGGSAESFLDLIKISENEPLLKITFEDIPLYSQYTIRTCFSEEDYKKIDDCGEFYDGILKVVKNDQKKLCFKWVDTLQTGNQKKYRVTAGFYYLDEKTNTVRTFKTKLDCHKDSNCFESCNP